MKQMQAGHSIKICTHVNKCFPNTIILYGILVVYIWVILDKPPCFYCATHELVQKKLKDERERGGDGDGDV